MPRLGEKVSPAEGLDVGDGQDLGPGASSILRGEGQGRGEKGRKVEKGALKVERPELSKASRSPW